MKDVFYRVGHYSENEFILDSDSHNYGQSFSLEYEYFLDCYFNIATKIDLPIDFLVFVNNGLANFGNDFIRTNITGAIVNEWYIELRKVTNNAKHNGIVMPIALLNEFIQSFNEQNSFPLFLEGKYLWERYFELVRINIFPRLPNRKDSIFLFDSFKACEYYIKTHNNGKGEIYEVELVHTKSILKADMKIFDDLDLSITHNNLLLELFKYWNSESSIAPVHEYIFQGKCKLKNIT